MVMMPRPLKALYYALMHLPMRFNGHLYRTYRQPRLPLDVHLGPGKEKYIEGWLNVDANIITARPDLWANLVDSLPFRDNSVSRIYSHHVIEHLPDKFLSTHFAEIARVLVPGGGIRICGPHGDNACRKFLENDPDWFDDFPDSRKSIGGRFVNFIFCRGEHLTMLSESYLTELATGAGLTDIRFCPPCTKSAVVDQAVLATETERDPDCPHTIVLEARKPEAPV